MKIYKASCKLFTIIKIEKNKPLRGNIVSYIILLRCVRFQTSELQFIKFLEVQHKFLMKKFPVFIQAFQDYLQLEFECVPRQKKNKKKESTSVETRQP